jgi:hypothetical protein
LADRTKMLMALEDADAFCVSLFRGVEHLHGTSMSEPPKFHFNNGIL